MLAARGYAAKNATSPLEPFQFKRRDVGPRDVLIDILFCGICHSDIHQVRNEWGGSTYPMVPGHEIAGRVAQVGTKVKRFKVGDAAGVGCFVDSCRTCVYCKKGLQQFCSVHIAFTYNATEMDRSTPTYGGYSSQIVVDEAYVLKIAKGLPLERVAPLLCAGITTYSPLKRWKVGPQQRVGILGLGGLGHMGLKLAVSMGAEVTVFSSSSAKEADARAMGARRFLVSAKPEDLLDFKNRFDFILDTVSAPHDLNPYLELLRPEGTMVLVGVPPKPAEVQAFSLIMGRRQLAGSLIGGIKETQNMLDYCAKTKVLSDVEVISVDEINAAYERVIRGDVRYRFVIDVKTL